MSFFAIRISSVIAVTLDYWGVDLWHGIQGGVGAQSGDLDFTWDGIIFKIGKHLPNPKYRFELTGELGHHTVSGLTNKNGKSAAFAFWLDRDFRIPATTLDFYFGLGSDLGHLSPKNNQPRIGNTGIIGVLRGKVGLRIPLK